MERKEMIEALMTNAKVLAEEQFGKEFNLLKKAALENEQIRLEGKTDLQLQNMLMINCF